MVRPKAYILRFPKPGRGEEVVDRAPEAVGCHVSDEGGKAFRRSLVYESLSPSPGLPPPSFLQSVYLVKVACKDSVKGCKPIRGLESLFVSVGVVRC